jgi:hypothetical protein
MCETPKPIELISSHEEMHWRWGRGLDAPLRSGKQTPDYAIEASMSPVKNKFKIQVIKTNSGDTQPPNF